MSRCVQKTHRNTEALKLNRQLFIPLHLHSINVFDTDFNYAKHMRRTLIKQTYVLMCRITVRVHQMRGVKDTNGTLIRGKT